jgi:hypothetical protein
MNRTPPPAPLRSRAESPISESQKARDDHPPKSELPILRRKVAKLVFRYQLDLLLGPDQVRVSPSLPAVDDQFDLNPTCCRKIRTACSNWTLFAVSACSAAFNRLFSSSSSRILSGPAGSGIDSLGEDSTGAAVAE